MYAYALHVTIINFKVPAGLHVSSNSDRTLYWNEQSIKDTDVKDVKYGPQSQM